MLKVKRLVSGITAIIRYAQSQKIGFWNNNHHQVCSMSKDWFLTETNILTLIILDDGYSRNQSFDFEST
jgi:hypothetical protein